MNTSIDRNTLIELLLRGTDRAKRYQRPTLVSFTQPIVKFKSVDLFESFRRLDEYAFFWEQPEQRFSMVSLGKAHLIETEGPQRFTETASAWNRLLEHAVIHDPNPVLASGPVLMGGFVYDADLPSTGLWQGFAQGSFALPRLQLNFAGEQNRLTFNVMVDSELDPQIEADNLTVLWDQAISASDTSPEIPDKPYEIKSEEALQPTEWKQIVSDATEAIAAGAFEKTVLARMIKITCSTSFDLKLALHRLSQFYPHAYVFAVKRGRRCFLGATPERLVRLDEGLVKTTALAGTARRGVNKLEDTLLGEQLMNSEKDRREHDVVVQMIHSTLSPICTHIDVPEKPVLLHLSNVQHLYTPIVGRLSAAKTLLDLVAMLHPTPAVCGLPRPLAQAYIQTHEKLDRGWYAGPVGWLDWRGDGEFAVALRSALVEDDQGFLFAGCGIVADSNPESEYKETVLKLGTMLFALGGEDRRKKAREASH
ncbi:MAG: isochorismate synthase [Methylococcaceae bacterium]|nr:isochorismate synthase [Methylococcaceae bacterium]